ncbi:Basic leucine zipper transcriptional factor ATF-like 3 [Galemys pyrenaicus]|uniref:Basic leucine zipper transcriptional factor ATF-like 3 n=1 Tax=Galemys pyrenaicus TaxID=202257 RepID=A0A8J6DD79_GALPY|nr:Basic leucine zipper transcriptional factor ATF-like 3 [Galemys pyrenaicus]
MPAAQRLRRGRGAHTWLCPQSPEDDDRKVRRREKNRVAAQRSRKKQTQKADKLHEVRRRRRGRSRVCRAEPASGSAPREPCACPRPCPCPSRPADPPRVPTCTRRLH